MGDVFFATGILTVFVTAGVILLASIPAGLFNYILKALALVTS